MPLDEAVEQTLEDQGQGQAEQRPGQGDARTLDEHLDEDAAAREPDQPQDAGVLAPLLGTHDHQRQQERGAADHRHGGDGHVEAFENDEDARGADRRADLEAGHTRFEIVREATPADGLPQGHVQPRDGLRIQRT